MEKSLRGTNAGALPCSRSARGPSHARPFPSLHARVVKKRKEKKATFSSTTLGTHDAEVNPAGPLLAVEAASPARPQPRYSPPTPTPLPPLARPSSVPPVTRPVAGLLASPLSLTGSSMAPSPGSPSTSPDSSSSSWLPGAPEPGPGPGAPGGARGRGGSSSGSGSGSLGLQQQLLRLQFLLSVSFGR